MEQTLNLSAEELAAVRSDYEIYAPTFLPVINPEGEEVPFAFRREQLYAQNVINLIRYKNKLPVKMRIYKARKRGMSTWAVGDMYHKSQTFHGRFWGEIYGHEGDSSSTLFEILKSFHEGSTDPLKKKVDSDNLKVLKFKDKSQIKVRTIQGDSLSRSGTPQYIIMTECAHYTKGTKSAATIVDEILKSMPQHDNTTLIQESTSRGFDDFWFAGYQEYEHELDKLCKKFGITSTKAELKRGLTPAYKILANGDWPRGLYYHIFIPWFWDPKNSVDHYREEERDILIAEVKATLNDYEHGIMQEHDLTHSQIAWRRLVRGGDTPEKERTMRQENPCTARESFVSTGQSVFGQEKVEAETYKVKTYITPATEADVKRIISGSPPPAKKITGYKMYYKQAPKLKSEHLYTGVREARVLWVPTTKMGEAQCYEVAPPVPGWRNRYVIGADCAAGLTTSDYDTAIVFDRLKRHVVAMFRDRIGISDFHNYLAMLGTRYNFADILVENKAQGETVLFNLCPMYPNVMESYRVVRGNLQYTHDVGHKTTPSSKLRMIGTIKDWFSQIPEGSKGEFLPFEEVLNEMSWFEETDKGKLEAGGSKSGAQRNYDDLVMALAFALEGDLIMTNENLRPREMVVEKYPTKAPKGSWMVN